MGCAAEMRCNECTLHIHLLQLDKSEVRTASRQGIISASRIHSIGYNETYMDSLMRKVI
jgi:hypothetical protein